MKDAENVHNIDTGTHLISLKLILSILLEIELGFSVPTLKRYNGRSAGVRLSLQLYKLNS